MIKILLLYKTGGEYDISYAKMLTAAIKRNITLEHEVLLLTDAVYNEYYPLIKEGIVDEIYMLSHGLPGWWSKIELFRIPGPVLYFDLDTVIVDNIDAVVETVLDLTNEIMMLKGFYRPDKCSGILGWNTDLTRVYNLYIKDYLPKAKFSERHNALRMAVDNKTYRGDQEWLQRAFIDLHQVSIFIQDKLPGCVCSYKVNIQQSEIIPDGVRIVCFHGKPRPHEVKPVPKWIKVNWYG